jgi:hypothetical protein
MAYNEWSDDDLPRTHGRDKFRHERSLERGGFDEYDRYDRKKRTRRSPTPPEGKNIFMNRERANNKIQSDDTKEDLLIHHLLCAVVIQELDAICTTLTLITIYQTMIATAMCQAHAMVISLRVRMHRLILDILQWVRHFIKS